MIRQNQVDGLLEASKHNLIAGLILNYRNENNDTFFIKIQDFAHMVDDIGKKSFNVKDLCKYNAIKINSIKKRTRYKYDISSLIEEIGLGGTGK